MDNNHNMPGQQNDKQEEQEYSLYTEKIVRKPGSRIKRAVKHIAKVRRGCRTHNEAGNGNTNGQSDGGARR